jgi:hypothetical protein
VNLKVTKNINNETIQYDLEDIPTNKEFLEIILSNMFSDGNITFEEQSYDEIINIAQEAEKIEKGLLANKYNNRHIELTAEEAWALYIEGWSCPQIGYATGNTQSFIHRLLKDAGYKLRDAITANLERIDGSIPLDRIEKIVNLKGV